MTSNCLLVVLNTALRKSNSGLHATKLKLNDDKTEAMTVETHFRSSVSCGEYLKFGDYEIPFKPLVKKVSVHFLIQV